ncbi:YgiT-type zinc finger protein [Acidobacteria bacterium ACD]|nr:YgiT-type zinc finger protein [Acidobacteria bacterium ACD]
MSASHSCLQTTCIRRFVRAIDAAPSGTDFMSSGAGISQGRPSTRRARSERPKTRKSSRFSSPQRSRRTNRNLASRGSARHRTGTRRETELLPMSVRVTCGANRVRRRTVKVRRRDGRQIIAPAFVCDSCGERVFDLKTLNMLAARQEKSRRCVNRVAP